MNSCHRIKLSFRKTFIFLVIALILSQGVGGTPAKASYGLQSVKFSEIDAYVQGEMKRANIPGLAYGIVNGEKVVHLQAFGIADPSGRPMTPQTPLIMGSVGKTFTALSIQQLVRAGKIELSAPVQRYISWFRVADPAASAQITIDHLINHISGLSHADGNQAIFFKGGQTLESFVRKMATLQLNRPVGSSYEYSNLNFLILGLVVEIVSGQSFADYVQSHIFDPLMMENSYLSEVKAMQNGLATGYHIWYGLPLPMHAAFPEGGVSQGFAISSVEDMTHYLIAYLNNGNFNGVSLLDPVESAPLQADTRFDVYWNTYSTSSARLSDGQSGGTNNFNGIVQITFDQFQGNYGVVILMNSRPDEVFEQVNAISIFNGIYEMLYQGRTQTTSGLEWYGWYLKWGLIDLALLGLISFAIFELISSYRWQNNARQMREYSKRRCIARIGVDLFATLMIIIIPPVLLGSPWRDLLIPYCELCVVFIGAALLLFVAAIWKIVLFIKIRYVLPDKDSLGYMSPKAFE